MGLRLDKGVCERPPQVIHSQSADAFESRAPAGHNDLKPHNRTKPLKLHNKTHCKWHSKIRSKDQAVMYEYYSNVPDNCSIY